MNCNVIQDLLPLYADDCCSEDSAKLTQMHLAHCQECRKIYDQMRTARKQQAAVPVVRLHRVSHWKASALLSAVMFTAFALLTLGVIREGGTPAGDTNGIWAAMLLIPATGLLLSLTNWYFVRVYRNRRTFAICSSITNFCITGLGYVWAYFHYANELVWLSLPVLLGGLLWSFFCIMSGVLSNRYALLLGRE